MIKTLEQIWRHPIKGVGAEQITTAVLTQGRPLPFDRAFAILTGDAVDTGEWQKCKNFARGCYGPSLMAVTASVKDDQITLSHPDLDDLTVRPVEDSDKVVEWVSKIYPAEQAQPTAVIQSPEIGMSDASFACLSIQGTASLKALSEACGIELDPRRFRGNLWFDGGEAFEERHWVGKRIQIGTAILRVDEVIDRCRATEANPETGIRDVNTLVALRKGWGHLDFGVKAVVETSGTIATGDTLEFI